MSIMMSIIYHDYYSHYGNYDYDYDYDFDYDYDYDYCYYCYTP